MGLTVLPIRTRAAHGVSLLGLQRNRVHAHADRICLSVPVICLMFSSFGWRIQTAVVYLEPVVRS